MTKTKDRILICGILPPPNFGHSMLHKVLMESEFIEKFDVTFLNMSFWSYQKHKKITMTKLLKLIKYYIQYVFFLIIKRPRYVLYGISFDKMPFLKDMFFCLTGRILGSRIVLHDMGQYLRELYDSSSVIFKRFIKFFMNNITASIVLGESTIPVYERFMDIQKVISVPGAVYDTARLYLDDKKKEEKNDRIVRVLYFSFMSVSKGFLTALHAIPQVIKGNSDVRFTFAGPMESTELQEKTDHFMEEHQLASYIEFLGYIDDEQRRTECFRKADIFIFPTHRDVFGLVLLHAMAEKLPIIASREGTIPEIIEEGENGFLFPKGDCVQLAEKILILAHDTDLRKHMGGKGVERYRSLYTPQCYGQRMIQAFEQIQESHL